MLFLWYYSSILIIGNGPRPGAPPGREHRFKSMKAIRSSSTQRLSAEAWKTTFLSFGYSVRWRWSLFYEQLTWPRREPLAPDYTELEGKANVTADWSTFLCFWDSATASMFNIIVNSDALLSPTSSWWNWRPLVSIAARKLLAGPRGVAQW